MRYCNAVSRTLSPKGDQRTESGCLLNSMSGPSFLGVAGLGVHEACVAALGLNPRSVGPAKFHELGRS